MKSHRLTKPRTARLGGLASAIALLLPMAVAGGCGALPDELPDEETTTAESALIVQSNGIRRPERLQNTITIQMCWRTAGRATEKAWVESIIANTWTANAWVVFTFAPTCPTDIWNEGVKIDIREANPSVSPNVGAAARVMTLNFDLRDFGGLACSGDNRRRCIEEAAVHEFGHVIGFVHESKHPQYNGCPEGGRPSTGSVGDLPMGPLDLGSIMTECGHNHSGSILSANDITWVRRLFGGNSATIHDQGVFALRRANGNFNRFSTQTSGFPLNQWLPTTSSRIVESDGTRNLVRLRRQSGSGNVLYGDKVSLQDVRTGFYYCFVDFGAMGSGVVGLNGPCSWEARRPGAVGGSTIHVNDPVSFRWPTTFNGNSVYLHSDHFWLLGPLPPS